MRREVPREPVAIYADGSVVGRNPSAVAGTYAWCHVNLAAERVRCQRGVVTPDMIDADRVTNTQAELFGLLLALEALPDGWSGRVCSDSQVTLRRFFESANLHGIPLDWGRRLGACLRRLGRLEPVQLKGHLLRAEPLPDGRVCSEHNLWCDKQARRAGRLFVEHGTLVAAW